jgi:hypothetical protein
MRQFYRLAAGALLAAFTCVTLATGTLTGGEKYEIPGWFKESFLEFSDDAGEAAEADKHALILVHAPE